MNNKSLKKSWNNLPHMQHPIKVRKNNQPSEREEKVLQFADNMKGAGKKMTLWITLPMIIFFFILFLLS